MKSISDYVVAVRGVTRFKGLTLSLTYRLEHCSPLPLCCWWLILPIQNDAKKLKNDRNPSIWVLI